MRQGRTVSLGAQPLKWVKQRAATVNTKRAIEAALAGQRERAAGSGLAPRVPGRRLDVFTTRAGRLCCTTGGMQAGAELGATIWESRPRQTARIC